MMKIVVLDAGTLGDSVLEPLIQFGAVDIHNNTEPDQVVERLLGATIALTNKVKIGVREMDNLPSLKMIGVLATGTNNIDLGAAKTRGIHVQNVAGYSTKSVAQHVFAMLFYLSHHLEYYNHYTSSGLYTKSPFFTHLPLNFAELSGKTFGIIGLGNIGRQVAKLAEAFGCDVCYYSTSGKNTNQEYRKVAFDTLLSTCDVISINAPLNENTQNLMGLDEFQKMKPTAYLINTGRGGIVVESDLAQALDDGLIAGAAIDVLEEEPMIELHPLLGIEKKERLLITPHIAWSSVEARQELIELTVKNIRAFIDTI